MSAISIKDVLSEIPTKQFGQFAEEAYRPHAQGPDDARFRLTRPFAGPIAASRLIAGQLLKKDPDYFDFDGSPFAGFDSETRFVISGDRVNMVAQILGDGEGKLGSFRLGNPTSPRTAEVAVADVGLNLAVSGEAMIMDYDNRGRFRSFTFRTPSLSLFQELVAPRFKGAERDKDRAQPLVARINFEGRGGRDSLDISWSQGSLVREVGEKLGQPPTDFHGVIRPARDIIVGVMNHFGVPTRI